MFHSPAIEVVLQKVEVHFDGHVNPHQSTNFVIESLGSSASQGWTDSENSTCAHLLPPWALESIGMKACFQTPLIRDTVLAYSLYVLIPWAT